MDSTIDGQDYQDQGALTIAYGNGEEEDEFLFQCLQGPDDQLYFLHEQSSEQEDGDCHERWLYRDSGEQWDPQQLQSISEELEVEVLDALAPEQLAWTDLKWISLRFPTEQAPPPFSGSDRALLIESEESDSPRLFWAVRLYRNVLGTLTSSRCPAESLPRVGLKETVGSNSSLGVLATALLLIGALLVGAATSMDLPLLLFWWGAPIALFFVFSVHRGHPAFEPLRFFAGCFFLHFCTHGLDVFFSQDWEEPAVVAFESVRATLLIATVLALRQWWPKGYHVVLDASNAAGGSAWLLTTFAFGMIKEEPLLSSWFRWYAGTLPWGALSLLFLSAGLAQKYSRYKGVPLSGNGLRSLLFQIKELLQQGLSKAHQECSQLVKWTSETAQAIDLAGDERIAALQGLREDFLALQQSAQTLKGLKLEDMSSQDKTLLESDLATLVSDLQDILDNYAHLGEGSSELRNLRVSPYLRWS